jgi:hypothetical protein
MTRVKQAGDRIEEILGLLRSGDAADAAAAEELVGLLVGLYGDGLGHIVATLRDAGPAGAELLAEMTEDPLVESLLLLHDLHPLDVDTRIQRALDRVRPYLGSHAGGVEYLGVTADGVARLRLEGSCHGHRPAGHRRRGEGRGARGRPGHGGRHDRPAAGLAGAAADRPAACG